MKAHQAATATNVRQSSRPCQNDAHENGFFQPHLQLYGRDYYAKKKQTTEAAFQDLKMIQSIAKTMTRPYQVPTGKGPVSLNANYRKKELFRITMDNHRLLERLENLHSAGLISDTVWERRQDALLDELLLRPVRELAVLEERQRLGLGRVLGEALLGLALLDLYGFKKFIIQIISRQQMCHCQCIASKNISSTLYGLGERLRVVGREDR